MESEQKACVAIVDDHPLFRQGRTGALRREQDFDVLGRSGMRRARSISRGSFALEAAVIDVLMPQMSGSAWPASCSSSNRGASWLSVIDDPCLIADMLRARGVRVRAQDATTVEIIEAIRQVLGGLRYLPPRVSRDAVEVPSSRGRSGTRSTT